MNTPLTGGCLCGAVRYQSSSAPVIAANCHCRDCQRASGSGYAPTLFIPADSLSIAGEVRYHAVKGDSGHCVSRGFCPRCGSSLFGLVELMPDLTAIRAGSLDDPAALPAHHGHLRCQRPALGFHGPCASQVRQAAAQALRLNRADGYLPDDKGAENHAACHILGRLMSS